jgi:phenylalanyl-tRNA synthetase beta chain
MRGFDKVPSASTRPLEPVPIPLRQKALAEVHRVMTSSGFRECITLSFDEGSSEDCGSPWTERKPIAIANPVAPEFRNLRRALLPGLLRARSFNADKGNVGARLYEVSRVYLPAEGEGLPDESLRLACVSDDDFRHARGVLEGLVESLGVSAGLRVEPWGDAQTLSWLDSGLSGRLFLGEAFFGVIGLAGKQSAGRSGVRPVLVEIDLERLLESFRLGRPFAALPKFPAVTWDLAVVVDAGIPWKDIQAVAGLHAGAYLESAQFFDIYEGEQVGAGRRSIAFTLTFRHPERTLTGEEVGAAVQFVIRALESELRGTIRSNKAH